MSITISTADLSLAKKSGALLFFTDSKLKFTGLLNKADKDTGNHLKTIMDATKFKGAKSSVCLWATPHAEFSHLLCVGTGEGKNTVSDFRKAGLNAFKKANAEGVENLNVVLEIPKNTKLDVVDAAAAFAEGLKAAAYKFDRFLTGEKKKESSLKKVKMLCTEHKRLKGRLALTDALMDGQNLARDLVNLPPNIANPDLMVKTAKDLGKEFSKEGLKIKVLGEKEMTKLGMNMLLAVGRASKYESRLIIMKYMGDKSSDKVSAVVGKGVMFDTGGYCLKPGASMAGMKADMGGAAAVMGMMKALAARKAKVNVIGVCGCVVNMIDEDGFLPSDIITSYSGKTVEIGNTDAEGRLVLGDAMSYIIDKESPDEIIDIATLTGACMVALGGSYAGIFSNNDKMANRLIASGDKTGERLWRLPIDDAYAAPTKVADLNNNGAPYGGASTAAVFLKNFNGDLPWSHLDIAGVGMAGKVPGNADVEGASGFGVRVLVDYLETNK